MGGFAVALHRRLTVSAVELNAAAIGLIGAAVYFIGWQLDVDPLKTLLPGFPEMRPRTALSFMILAVCCVLSLRSGWMWRWLAAGLAAWLAAWLISLVVGALSDAQWQGEALLRIQGTFVSVVLGCVAIVIVSLAPRVGFFAAIIAVLASAPALYRMLGLLLFQGAPEDGGPLNSMGLHTAVLVVWFMIGCVLLHPRLGYGAVLRQASPRGRALRLALPFIVLVPVTSAGASLALAQALGWRQEVLFAMTATLSVVIGVCLVWWLAKLVGQWQAEATERAGRLARANEALEQYASSAAHDLRAPARHVSIYGELIEEAARKGDLAAVMKHAASLRRAAKEMPAIIDGMLEFSRSGFTRLTLGRHRLRELTHSAVELLAGDIEAAGAHVGVRGDAELSCDGQLMTTVLQNLIANSIENRREGVAPKVIVELAQAKDGWLVSVTDNGKGFDPAYAAVAFNPLARGAKQAGTGAGIGLATCKSIVAAHGGRIRIDASHMGGARVEIMMPAEPPAGPQTGS